MNTRYDIPRAMVSLHNPLHLFGFVKSTLNQQPSEWRGQNGTEVLVCHVAGRCEIKATNPRHQLMFSQPHGQDEDAFRAWLGRCAELIIELDQHAGSGSHEDAPDGQTPTEIPESAA